MVEKLYSFCYARTNDSYEAQDICSDIIFALVNTDHIPKIMEYIKTLYHCAGRYKVRTLHMARFSTKENIYQKTRESLLLTREDQ